MRRLLGLGALAVVAQGSFFLGVVVAHDSAPVAPVRCLEDEVYAPNRYPVRSLADLTCEHPDNLAVEVAW